MMPRARDSQDETSFVVVSTQTNDDDVSLLSFDATYANEQMFLKRPQNDPGTDRFSGSNRSQPNDVLPKRPSRQDSDSDKINEFKLQSIVASRASDSKTNPGLEERSRDSSSRSTLETATTIFSTDSSNDQLGHVVELIEKLGRQASVGDVPCDSNSSNTLGSEEEINMLRYQLEQERRQRENVELELSLQKDFTCTAKAELALKKVVNDMQENLRLIQDKKEANKARRELNALVSQFSKRHGLAGPVITLERSCFPILETASVSSNYDHDDTVSHAEETVS